MVLFEAKINFAWWVWLRKFRSFVFASFCVLFYVVWRSAGRLQVVHESTSYPRRMACTNLFGKIVPITIGELAQAQTKLRQLGRSDIVSLLNYNPALLRNPMVQNVLQAPTPTSKSGWFYSALSKVGRLVR